MKEYDCCIYLVLDFYLFWNLFLNEWANNSKERATNKNIKNKKMVSLNKRNKNNKIKQKQKLFD